MVDAATISTLIKDLIWPVVFLIVIMTFRKPISILLTRVMNFSAEVGDLKLAATMRDHVSESTYEQIKKNPSLVNAKPEFKKITVLYAQVRGFTNLQEGLEPEKSVYYFNKFLTEMQSVIFKHGGTVDRYDGTSIFAYWGAPIDYPDNADRACNAALDMVKSVKELSHEYEAAGMPRLNPNYAITTDTVVAGNMGLGTREKYVIRGDYEDVLQRLSGLNINYQTNIVLTEYAYELVSENFEFKMLSERIRIKGKASEITLYELVGKK